MQRTTQAPTPEGAVPRAGEERSDALTLGGPGRAERLDDLHARTAAPVTARRPWLAAWAQAHRGIWTPWPLLVGDEAAVDAAALLARRTRAGLTHFVSLGHVFSDYSRLSARDEAAAQDLASAVAAALASLRGPWRLRMEQLPQDDPVVRALRDRLPHTATAAGDGAPKVDLTRGEPFGSSSYRQQVRMCHSRLERAGLAKEVCYSTDPAEISALLPQIQAIRQARDHSLDRVSDLDDPVGLAFWRAVVLEFAAREEAEVATLSLNGEIQAYCIGIPDGSTWRMWDHRFRPGMERYRLGQLLEMAVIERAAADGRFSQLDRMRGVTPQKMRTAHWVEPTQHFMAWSSTWVRAADQGASSGRRRLADWRGRDARVDRAWRVVKRATVLRGRSR